MLNYTDAHNHITAKVPINSIYNTYKLEDITDISVTLNQHRAIGLHPMYLPKSVNWDNIEQMLIANGKLMIGEVGLDKRSKQAKSQVEYFNKFLSLAIKYNLTT